MKQFSLEEYLANPTKKVVTRSGKDVRILCTDAKGGFPIVALIKKYDPTVDIVEEIYTYPKSGMFLDGAPRDDDLFFVPEKHEGWINIYENTLGQYEGRIVYDNEEDAKKHRTSNCLATVKIEWEE